MSVARSLCFLRREAPPPRKLSISDIVLTAQRRFPWPGGCAARSPHYSRLCPLGARRPCEPWTPPCCWQDRRGLLWLPA